LSHRRHFRVLVCRGPECGDKRGSAEIFQSFQKQVAGCGATVEMDWQSCFGRCTQGPNVLVREITPEQAGIGRSFATAPRAAGRLTALYNAVTVGRVEQIVRGHLVDGRVQRQFVERPRRASDGDS
jgi:(2Fe-2S) ferredoxin